MLSSVEPPKVPRRFVRFDWFWASDLAQLVWMPFGTSPGGGGRLTSRVSEKWRLRHHQVLQSETFLGLRSYPHRTLLRS